MLTVLFWIDSQRSHTCRFIFENHSCHLLCLGGILSAMNWSWLIVELLTVTMLEWDQSTVGTCLSDVLIIYNNRLAANTSVLDVDLPWIQSRSVNNIMLLFSTRWSYCTMIQHNSEQHKNILHSSDIFFFFRVFLISHQNEGDCSQSRICCDCFIRCETRYSALQKTHPRWCVER